MTAQVPEEFINEYPANELDGLHLYSIQVNGASTDWEVLEKCGIPKLKLPFGFRGYSTALYRGYIATYKLTPEGKLFFWKYRIPIGLDDGYREQLVEEYLKNDFVLVFREFFSGESLLVPFQNGIIVTDRSKWEIMSWSIDRNRWERESLSIRKQSTGGDCFVNEGNDEITG